jgi:hypothetical protein
MSSAVAVQQTQSGQPTSSEDNRRLAQMKDAWDAYFGRFPQPLKVRPGGADDNVIVNRCRPPVNKIVAGLFGRDVAFQLEEGASEEAQQWLNDCWRFNKKSLTLKKWGTTGAVCGAAFLKIVPAAPGQKFPRVVVLDPTMVSVQTAPDDVDTPVAFQVCWTGYDVQTAQQMRYREVTIQAPNKLTWQIITQHRQNDADAWITDNSVTWAKPWSPIHACQNLPAPNQFWGLPILSPDVIQANRDLNFFYSNAARILRLHAHPKDWIKGMRAKELEVAIDETLVLHNKDAEIGSLEMQAAGITAVMQMIAKLESVIETLTSVPAITTGANIDAVPKVTSGVALTILHQPWIDVVESLRETYGDTLCELNSHLLELGSYGAGIMVSNHWPDLMPGDDLALAQVAQLVDQMGLASKETLSTQMGYDWEQEQQRLQNEAKAQADSFNAGIGMHPLAAQFGQQTPINAGIMHPAMQAQRQATVAAAQQIKTPTGGAQDDGK